MPFYLAICNCLAFTSNFYNTCDTSSPKMELIRQRYFLIQSIQPNEMEKHVLLWPKLFCGFFKASDTSSPGSKKLKNQEDIKNWSFFREKKSNHFFCHSCLDSYSISKHFEHILSKNKVIVKKSLTTSKYIFNYSAANEVPQWSLKSHNVPLLEKLLPPMYAYNLVASSF